MGGLFDEKIINNQKNMSGAAARTGEFKQKRGIRNT